MVVQRQGWEGTRGGVYSGERGVPEVQTTGGGATEEPTHYLYSLSGLAKCTRCLQIGGQLGFETQFHSEAEEEQFFLTPFLTLFLKIEGATS